MHRLAHALPGDSRDSSDQICEVRPSPADRAGAAPPADGLEVQRRGIVDYCHVVLHGRAGQAAPALGGTPKAHGDASPAGNEAVPGHTTGDETEACLSPRMRQTLEYLLGGDSEKQIARKLSISPHTVHVYVKQLYKRYNVNSRGELVARWVRR